MRSASSPRVRAIALGVLAALAASVAALWFELAGSDGHDVTGPAVSAVEPAVAPDGPALSTDGIAGEDRAGAQLAAAIAQKTRTRSAKSGDKPARWSGGVITGRVLGGPGASEPIAGIGVRATAPRSLFAVPERRTRTDAQGRFELRDLVTGHWEVEASLPDIDLRGASSVDIDEKETPTAELDVLLPYERHVEARLIDVRGDPITAEALGIDPVFLPLVCVGLARSCHEPGSVLGPADMPLNRVMDKSPKGARTTFDVAIQGAGGECLHGLFGDRVIASRAIGREDVRVDIVLDGADVARFLGVCAVQVVEAAHGAPVTSGQVGFRLPGAQIARALGPDGIASVAGLPFGPLRAVVEVPGFVTRTVDVVVPTEAPLRIELVPARRLAGRIAVEGGRTGYRFKAGVWRVRAGSAKLGEPTLRASKWSESGDFAFEGLEPAIYVVAAVPDSVALLSADDVRDGKGSGAAWIDLTRADGTSVRIEVPSWLASDP